MHKSKFGCMKKNLSGHDRIWTQLELESVNTNPRVSSDPTHVKPMVRLDWTDWAGFTREQNLSFPTIYDFKGWRIYIILFLYIGKQKNQKLGKERDKKKHHRNDSGSKVPDKQPKAQLQFKWIQVHVQKTTDPFSH